MKNKKFQARVAAAKRHLKNRQSFVPLVEGVEVIYVYDGTRTLTYWDDFGFRCGSQWMAIWFQHPRYVLMERLKEIVRDRLWPIHNDFEFVFDNGTFEVKNPEAFDEYMKSCDSMFHELLESDEHYVELTRPKVKQYEWGRGTDLIYPIELLSKNDVVQFAHRVKAHMLGREDLFKGLEGYRYTTADFRRELPNYRELHGV